MKNIKYIYGLLGILLIAMLQVACKKEKFDEMADNRPVTASRPASNVRVVNLGNYNQVVANNDSLTNFLVLRTGDINSHKYPGTDYFPEDGRLGSSWTIPQDLFDAQQKLKLDVATRLYSFPNKDLSLNVDYAQNTPTDYYLLDKAQVDNIPDYLAVPRSVTSPSKPDHFKIRIINLSGTIKTLVFNSSGAQESLDGPVTLSYADGTPVSTQTSNVSTGTRVSEYVEVPYGTYQFKVLTANGRQIPATGSSLFENGVIDPPTSTIALSMTAGSKLTYAPIQTYQPGGIYTIVVSPQSFDYFVSETNETAGLYQNSFKVITDNSVAANLTYCRVQGFNAMPQQQVSFTVGGHQLGSALAFGAAGNYSSIVNGRLEIQAKDASGRVIATATENLRAAQNYTVWLYPDANGSPKLLVVANDLSGTVYRGAGDDATYARLQLKYFFNKRYLNLSAGNPYITFTTNNGEPSGLNLQPGVPLLQGPYVSRNYTSELYEIMAYRSSPNVVPGIWADDIPVLTSDMFIANKQLYTNAGRVLPAHEPGVFTVALIGRTGSGVTDADKARMIIIKHTK